MKKNCKYLTYSYEEHERYDSCKKKPKNYNNDCIPCIECNKNFFKKIKINNILNS